MALNLTDPFGMLALRDAVRGIEDPSRALRDAVRGIEDPNRALREEVRGVEDPSRALREAVRGVEDPNRALREAMPRMEDPNRALREAMPRMEDPIRVLRDAAVSIIDPGGIGNASGALHEVIARQRSPFVQGVLTDYRDGIAQLASAHVSRVLVRLFFAGPRFPKTDGFSA